MTPLKPRFSLAAPPPKIVLLPDGQFFTRVVPVAETGTAAEVAAQVELALEALAPFPLAQMYHGHFWKEGAKHALVFAAYQKRFTSEQTAEWADAEVVMPAFAALLGSKAERATTVLLNSGDTLTAIHWSAAESVPDFVSSRVLPPELGEVERLQVRDELLRAAGDSVKIEEVEGLPLHDPESVSGDLGFRAGAVKTAFTREELDALDVRDKAELAMRRRARSRDLLLWRILVGAAAAIAFALVLELTVIGGKIWQNSRVSLVAERAPIVAEINKANELASRIEQLSTKRLLPFEMIDLVKAKQPPSVVFTRVTALSSALYTLDVRGQTSMSGDVVTFQSALNALPECESVLVEEQETRGGTTFFRFKITFKTGSLKAADQS